MKTCQECGSNLNSKDVFCNSCGRMAKDVNIKKESLAKSMPVNSYKANPLKQESPLANGISQGIVSYAGPFKNLFLSISNTIKNVKNVFTDTKTLIVTIVIALVWIVLGLLQAFGIKPFPLKFLSFFTYAQGGFSSSFFRQIGGLLGKGIFATFVISFFTGAKPFMSFGRNFKSIFKSTKLKNLKDASISLIGFALAFIFFSFISGQARFLNSISGIACFFMAVRSFSKGNSFLKNFFISIVAKKKDKKRIANEGIVNNLASSFTLGLALSVFVSMIPYMYLLYIMSGVFILTAIIFAIVSSQKKKQALARVLLLLLFYSMILPIISIAKGTNDDWAGYWTYQKTVVIEEFDKLGSYYSSNSDDLTRVKASYKKNVYYHEFNYIGEEVKKSTVYLKDGEYIPIHIHKGERFKGKVKVQQPPKYLREDEKVTLKVEYELTDSFVVYYDSFRYHVTPTMAIYKDKNKPIDSGYRLIADFEYAHFDIRDEKKVTTNISGHAPYGRYDGDIMGIEVKYSCSTIGISGIHSVEEDQYTKLTVVHLYEWKYGLNIAGATSKASDGPGETEVSIPAAIVTSALGLASALGAASGALDLGQKEKSSSDEKGSTYKMSVLKDFGDKLRHEDPPVLVYARMIEVTKSSREIDRPDLTSQIEIFTDSPSLSVDDNAFVDGYMGAYVSVRDLTNEEGAISFKFTGEGGHFQNNVIFYIIGQPYITYPDIKSHSGIMDVTMIMGDKLKYQCKMEVKDFVEKATVTVNDNENFDIEIEMIDDINYILHINNKTSPSTSPFTKPNYIYIDVHAETEEEKADSQFLISLYPEGLSIDGDFKEDKLQVIAYQNENRGERDPEIKPSRLKLILALIENKDSDNPSSRIVNLEEVELEIGKLIGADEATNSLAEKFEYDVEAINASEGIYHINPKKNIPQGIKPYYLSLPIKCKHQGEDYSIDLPIQILGDKLDPKAGWDKEYDLLKARISRYGIDASVARILRENLDKMSTDQLRLISRKIIMDGIDFYAKQSLAYQDIANTMERWENFLGVLKWFGDQAFSYLVTIYAGPVAEAVISPAKEIVVSLIGEAGSQIIAGYEFNIENLQVGQNIAAAFENYLMTTISGEGVSIKKAGAVMAGFLVFNVSKHYVLDVDAKGNRDFYAAITAGFSDLTETAIKAIAGHMFDKLVNDPKIAKKINDWGGRWLKQYLPDMAFQKPGQDILGSGLSSDTAYIFTKVEFVQKYVEELCGMGAAKAYALINEGTEKLVSNNYVFDVVLYEDTENPQNTIKVSVDLVRVKDKLFDFIFNNIFGVIPFPTTSINPPDDPPYYSDIK